MVYQLEDKLEAHKRYIHFLTDVGLLDKVQEGEILGTILSMWEYMCVCVCVVVVECDSS